FLHVVIQSGVREDAIGLLRGRDHLERSGDETEASCQRDKRERKKERARVSHGSLRASNWTLAGCAGLRLDRSRRIARLMGNKMNPRRLTTPAATSDNSAPMADSPTPGPMYA